MEFGRASHQLKFLNKCVDDCILFSKQMDLATCWKAGVSSKQFWNNETLAKMYKPNLARDMATTKRLTSLKCPTALVLTKDSRM